MYIRNLSNRSLSLRDSAGTVYRTGPYGDLDINDSVWADNEFRRQLRLRIREVEVESVTAGEAGAPIDAPFVTTAVVAGLSQEKVLGTAIIMKGTLAARPAASINGRLYYVTDTGSARLTRDTGSAWENLNHGDTHAPGGLDPITAPLDTNARVAIRKNSGSNVGVRRAINFIEGNGISLTIADDAGSEEVDVTIAGGLSTGFIAMWGATTPPAGWLVCDGSAVSRTTYATLFGVISTGWGVGDNSTTFNLPDLRGRFPVGVGTNTDVNALGKNEGLTVGDRRPKHKHTVSDGGHSHTTSVSVSDPSHSHVLGTAASGSGNAGAADRGEAGYGYGWKNTGGSYTGISVGVTANANYTGISVGTQSNAPTDQGAFLAVPFIIKT